MSYGLQLFDGAGNLALSLNDRAGRIIGILTFSWASNSTVDLYFPGVQPNDDFAVSGSVLDSAVPFNLRITSNYISVSPVGGWAGSNSVTVKLFVVKF